MVKNLTPIIVGAAVVQGFCFLAIASANISKNLASKQAISARQEALINIAKHTQSETCWYSQRKTPYKIGDPYITGGSATGKIPTSCVIASNTNQYLEVAYMGEELQIIRVFSPKEVNAALSNLKTQEEFKLW